MQRVIEKFLQIRRTVYPVHAEHQRCSEPRNLTELAIEHCRNPYCQTLILTNHETGKFHANFICKRFFVFFLNDRNRFFFF